MKFLYSLSRVSHFVKGPIIPPVIQPVQKSYTPMDRRLRSPPSLLLSMSIAMHYSKRIPTDLTLTTTKINNIIMLATSLRRTILSAAKKSSCINTTATATSRCFASAPVDFDHFSSGWEKDSSEYKTEGKFHIETFNKISPLVSLPFFLSISAV